MGRSGGRALGCLCGLLAAQRRVATAPDAASVMRIPVASVSLCPTVTTVVPQSPALEPDAGPPETSVRLKRWRHRGHAQSVADTDMGRLSTSGLSGFTVDLGTAATPGIHGGSSSDTSTRY
jgi:hypothetical protein